jgi:hypothetical protein
MRTSSVGRIYGFSPKGKVLTAAIRRDHPAAGGCSASDQHRCHRIVNVATISKIITTDSNEPPKLSGSHQNGRRIGSGVEVTPPKNKKGGKAEGAVV